MTVLQALQSLTEYENDNLLSKALADVGLSSTDTYEPDSHRVKVDLAGAEVYEHLAAHPELNEGKFKLKYNAGVLLSLAKKLRRKHGIEAATISGGSVW